ncbi:MAG: cytochrome c-type biogenesis protein CcmH, partial [Acidobacteria bacterium]|nr:cytochrome c-type biogenesis protein CcmH [Acidobacteriota bacterium]
TRSGIVQSVHAFGEDPELGRMFIIFMITIAVVSFGFVIYRLPMLKARNELESWASREGAFLANNWILLFSAFFILFATMFPTITEALSGERMTVGPPFFNKWMTPVGLMLLFLTGVGPLLAWRKTSAGNLIQQFLWPTVAGLTAGGLAVALGVRVWSSGVCFALCGFVIGTISQEYIRGASVRAATSGADLVTAMVGLVGRNKRRYGGYIVHVGIVLMFLGFAGEGMSTDEQLLLKPGNEAVVGKYIIHLDAIRATDDGQKQMVTGHITVKTSEGREIGKLYPAKWYFRKHEEEPTTEVAIRHSVAEDLYVVMAGYELQEQTASIEVHINPLINWVWVGFGVLAIGTMIALLPETAVTFALSKLPAEAATVSLLLLMLLLGPAAAAAQHVETPQMGVVLRTAAEKAVTSKLACWCGCPRLPVGSCACGMCALERQNVQAMLNEGKSEAAILQHYIDQQGGLHVLIEPPNEGVGKLSWMVPYGAGMSGLLLAGFVAVRWSRRSDADALAAGATPSEDAALGSRLDDELRDLD